MSVPRAVPLGPEARAAALKGLQGTGWVEVQGRDAIARSFRFASFSEAFGFMARVALLAERMDHHPEWSNVYGRVEILLTTHEAKAVSERDVAMARAIDALL